MKKIIVASMVLSMLMGEFFLNQPTKSKALFVNSPKMVIEDSVTTFDLSQYKANKKIIAYHKILEAAPYGYIEVRMLITYASPAHIGGNDYLFIRYDSLTTFYPGSYIEDNSNYNKKYYSCTTSQAIYNPNNTDPRVTLIDYWPRSGEGDPVRREVLTINGVDYQVCQELVWPGLNSIFGQRDMINPDAMLKLNYSSTESIEFYSIQKQNEISDPRTYSVTAFNNYPGCHAKFYNFSSDKNHGEDGIKTNQQEFTFYYGSLFAVKKENNQFGDIINWYSNYEVGSKNALGYIQFKTQLEFQVNTSFILR